MNVFPVGHYIGERHPDQLHLVRLGPAHQTLTADEFGVWILAHGVTESRSWTVADVLALADRTELAGAPEAVARLESVGALVQVPAEGQVAFAEAHRLEPLLVGLGNSAEYPDTYAVGLPGNPPVAMLDSGSYELWQWAAVAPSLWQACEVRAKVGAGLGDPTSAADLLDDVLGDLRPLLANSCAYLDVIRRR
jgi:hypothetical protein